MPLFTKIAERHPQLTLIVDHMGISAETMHAGKTAETVAETAALAKYSNVSVKLSSIPLFSKEDYPWRDVTPHVRRLFDAYGPRRSHWGTDATNSFDKATYRQRVTQFTEQIDFMSAEDLDWVMGGQSLNAFAGPDEQPCLHTAGGVIDRRGHGIPRALRRRVAGDTVAAPSQAGIEIRFYRQLCVTASDH